MQARLEGTLIQTSLLLSCKDKDNCLVQQKQRGLYQKTVNSSLVTIQRPGHLADNCAIIYSQTMGGVGALGML